MIGSVVLGFVLWSILWVVYRAVLTAVSPTSFNPDGSAASAGVLVFFLIWSVLISIASGWITSKVAAARARTAAWALGIVLLLVGIAVQGAYWDLMPLWYHVCFLALLIPGVLVGHRLQGGGA
jgi:hypothetical protein